MTAPANQMVQLMGLRGRRVNTIAPTIAKAATTARITGRTTGKSVETNSMAMRTRSTDKTIHTAVADLPVSRPGILGSGDTPSVAPGWNAY
jgi:hypothetical protein